MNVVKTKGNRIFFGWWIVISAFFIFMTTSALLFTGFGAYFIFIQKEMMWSKTLISGAFSMSRMESGIVGPIQGWLVKKIGPRLVIQIGIVILAAGFMLFSKIDSIFDFYVVFFFMSLGLSLAGYLTISTSLINWFERKRATALGISNSGSALGGLMVPIVAWSLVNFGWRDTAFYSGILTLIILLPASLLIRKAPEEYGLFPDGDLDKRIDIPKQQEANRPRTNDLSLKQALRTSAFWYTSLGHASALFVVSAMMLHLIPYIVDNIGVSVQSAALVAAAMTGVQLFGQLSGGFLSDRVEKRKVIVICMFGHVITPIGLAFTTSLPLIFFLVILHGLSWGVRGPLMAAIRADYFGRSSFATIMGFSSMIAMIGMIIGPLIAGLSADFLGSYRWGFFILGIFPALGAACFYLAKNPIHYR